MIFFFRISFNHFLSYLVLTMKANVTMLAYLTTKVTVAVVFSVSGEAEYAVTLAKTLKKYGCSMICISNTDHNTIARLSDITLPYFITQHRTPGNSWKAADHVDFTSQVPAVTLAELLAKRLARRLDEE